MRILFVAMPGSVHTARWINHISDKGWDVYLFSSTPEPVHPNFRNLTIYSFSSFRPKELDPSVRIRGLLPLGPASEKPGHSIFQRLGRLSNTLNQTLRYPIFHRLGPSALAGVIRWLKPDIIHSMEIQHAGYLTLEARAKLKGRFPPWVVSDWGSDIYLFGRLSEHQEKIRAVMSACDYYHTECHRDVRLAKEFGFKGEVLPVLPVAGGFDIESIRKFRQPGPTSARRLIVLKGNQGWVYRALVGLRAIELCADLLLEKGYRVAIYLASPDTQMAAKLLTQSSGLPIEIIPRSPHEEMLRLHGRARASIGLGISDALSTSALEAVVMGSFPIQSNTSCLGEIVRDGESGILVHPEDPEAVAAALRRAVTDDELVDRAAEINARAAEEHLSHSVVRPQLLKTYESIAAKRRVLRGTSV